jgi:hypothetical protein
MKWLEDLKIEKGETITNVYSGQSCELSEEAVAVYDFIKGTEFLLSNYDCSKQYINNFQEALQYFQEKWPKEYLILLD